jgi:dephospho-CoA kinase
VPAVLVTGMSGVGKSTVLAELERRGHRVVDTDVGGWIDESGPERLWREERVAALLEDEGDGALFVAGTVANQGRLYGHFDAVVLLSAPVAVMLERLEARTGNAYGKTEAERGAILRDCAEIEPLLRARATAEIDTSAPVEDVADALEQLAGVAP